MTEGDKRKKRLATSMKWNSKVLRSGQTVALIFLLSLSVRFSLLPTHPLHPLAFTLHTLTTDNLLPASSTRNSSPPPSRFVVMKPPRLPPSFETFWHVSFPLACGEHKVEGNELCHPTPVSPSALACLQPCRSSSALWTSCLNAHIKLTIYIWDSFVNMSIASSGVKWMKRAVILLRAEKW